VLSGDGRYVAFKSAAENLTADDVATYDVFARDTVDNTLALVSRGSGPTGAGALGSSLAPAISSDGRFVAFISEADNLSTADDDAVQNVFRRELPPGLAPPPPPPPDLGTNDGHGGHGGDGGHLGGTAEAHGDAHAGGHPAAGPGASGHAGHSGASAPGATGPGQTVTAARRQRIDRLVVTSTLHENGSIAITGKVAMPGRAARVYSFKKVNRKTPAHRLNIVRLRLGARALNILNRALRRGQRLKAVITVTGIDRAGSRNPVTKTIRLLPQRKRR
jgi:hypothetical protein